MTCIVTATQFPGLPTRVLVLALCALLPAATFAFQIGSLPEEDKNSLRQSKKGGGFAEWAIQQFGGTAHEAITWKSYGCEGPVCASLVPKGTMVGLLWADVPSGFPVSGTSRACKDAPIGLQVTGKLAAPPCTMGYVIDGARQARGPGQRGKRGSFHSDSYLTLYRTHFGDMQWMHAMAEDLDEPAEETRASMLAWGSFLYRLATPDEREQLRVDVPLGTVPQVSKWFSGSKREWTARDLFATRQGRVPEAMIRDIAFGALLHLAQDSYSASHLARKFEAQDAPFGRIAGFYTYPAQKGKCHTPDDSEPMAKDGAWWSMPAGMAAVEAGSQLIAFRKDRTKKAADVEKWLLRSVFALSDEAQGATAGFDRKCTRTFAIAM